MTGPDSREIYEAVFDDEALAALPAMLARSAGARSGLIHWRHRDQSHEVFAYSYFTPRSMELYASTYAAIDPWVVAAETQVTPNEIIRLDRHVPAAAFEASRIHREFVTGQGDDTFHCVGAAFRTRWGQGLLGVHRGRRATPFEDHDLGALTAAAPHLRRMLQVRGELAAHRHTSMVARDALDRLAVGAVVARADGQVVQANRAADGVLRRADGLVVKGGRLTGADPASRARLEAALAAATTPTDPSANAIAVERGGEALAYLVSVTPMAGLPGRALALLVFRDPDLAEESLEPRLRSLFQLTRIEAAIAADLSRGLSAPAIARKRGVRPNTVKTQLASLSAKMGCGRQSEIAARVAGLPPMGAST